ncbi:5' nucleotidase, NT5C type [Alishewanella longhuensis]
MQQIIYIDMDDTLCDYKSSYDTAREMQPDILYPQSQAGFFLNLPPYEGAIETASWLFEQPEFLVLLLTAPSVLNPLCYTEKRLWVERHFGLKHCHRLIISAHKGLSRGDFLIDDKKSGFGQEDFQGELIHYGSAEFTNWASVKAYFAELLRQKSTGN